MQNIKESFQRMFQVEEEGEKKEREMGFLGGFLLSLSLCLSFALLQIEENVGNYEKEEKSPSTFVSTFNIK